MQNRIMSIRLSLSGSSMTLAEESRPALKWHLVSLSWQDADSHHTLMDDVMRFWVMNLR